MDANTGLALEYQGNYGTARRDLDIADLINNPGANGLCRAHGVSLAIQARINAYNGISSAALAAASSGVITALPVRGRIDDDPDIGAGASGHPLMRVPTFRLMASHQDQRSHLHR